MTEPLSILLTSLAVPPLMLALAIVFGGPRRPRPRPEISRPFEGLDMSALPPLAHVRARDGASLAYRRYAPAGACVGSVVLVHGSSASSRSLHLMGMAFARAGHAAYALDIRGHGDSGPRGRIAHVGQLEEDLQDFVDAVQPERRRTLVGFSSGGGFALRVAGGAQAGLFDGFVLVAPFLHQDAPTARPDRDWASVGIGRLVAIGLLRALGLRVFGGLPVLRFPVDAASAAGLTATYDHALATNFRPRNDYAADIRAARRPLGVLVGSGDELFQADRFGPLFADLAPDVRVETVDGVGHVGMTLEPAALARIVAAVARGGQPAARGASKARAADEPVRAPSDTPEESR